MYILKNGGAEFDAMAAPAPGDCHVKEVARSRERAYRGQE
jgi:hypothetical protein